ncbi:MAG TPA: MBL fold metallo-hydrolase [Solirubrobacteraceae bacterium]|jgi:glyoxylase-like metal-dependent hydrolase (beta-lactamase superfamily II)|nr:MBL fold metallo-hydrolase [Solirubrobacteraceae bacterium]
MKVQALSTGTVSLKDAFLFARSGPMRQLSLFLPGPFSDARPIHVWVIEHEGARILVDTGETASVQDIPFAHFDVSPTDELPGALSTLGLAPGDCDTVVLTHMHGDHMDGAVHLDGARVLVNPVEIAFSKAPMSRFFQRVLHQPVPDGVRFEPFPLEDGPFGAFAASRKLSDDGRIVAVATPGHTPGHISIICIDDDGTHLFIAGDTTDTLEQLHSRRHDAVGVPKVTVATIDKILAHAKEHPTVYLPSHDLDSAARLASRTTL